MSSHFSVRGSKRGSGFRGRSARERYSSKPQPRSIPPPLGLEIARREFDQMKANVSSHGAEISDVQYVASYNLLEGLQKTIFVPGKPPMWTPLPGPTVLREDSGQYYRDENAACFPDYPMEPAVTSIMQMNPSFDYSEVDIFACGSTLGDILRFSLDVSEPFTFTVHMIGKTAFFLRRNHSPTELIDNIHGYGHAFPEAYTTWGFDVKGSSSHQRVIKYSFGGLRFLVRFEADGYILDQLDDSDGEEESNTSQRPHPESSSMDPTRSLVEQLLDSGIKSKLPSMERSEAPLTVRPRGRRIDQSSVFDLKTRSARKQRADIMSEQLPRLWIRQIRSFILAFHTSGRFDTPDVLDVSSDLDEWEQRSNTALSRMVTLIKDIRDTAMATEGEKIEVRLSESSTLQYHKLSSKELGNWNALPNELQKVWAKK